MGLAPMLEKESICVRIFGKVQGVWYRAWTAEQADRLGLGGWVRNRRDGSVEAVFCGEPESVTEMVRLCHDGPPHAVVSHIEVDEAGLQESVASGFFQRETV